MKQTITEEELTSFEADFESQADLKCLQNAITKNGINASTSDQELLRSLKNTFSIDLESGDVCNQKQSGRCWMFAGLNVLRTILFKKLNVKNIELSQAYLQFYDKLEKANFLLEKAICFASEDVKSRNNVFLLDSTLGDGGHFVMFTNLVKKYGVLPLEEMPDLAVSQATGELNDVLSKYLAQAYKELREKKNASFSMEELQAIKEGYLKNVYKILAMSLGTPVKEFTYEYMDKDNKYHKLEKMTPKQFFDTYIQADLNDYIPLCDAPIEGMKPLTKYTCDLVNNVIGGDDVIFFNATCKDLKESCIASLKDGTPVWFGSDVSSQSLRKDGYLASGILKRKEAFHLDYHMDKSSRLTYRSSFCNHAMTLTGVNLDENGIPNRWKVENSWGKDNGKNGYYVMSDLWFDDFVYEVFVNRKYVKEEILKAYDESPVIKEDPFDTLWAMMR